MQATMEQGTSIEIISFALAESLFIFLSPTLKKKNNPGSLGCQEIY
jgi:hypothetical protein